MATSEPLVPRDLPYGERQNVRAGMQQAGIPLAPTRGGQLPVRSVAPGRPQPGPDGPPVSGLDLLRGRTPGDFPFINSETNQSPAAAEPGSVLAGLGASAQSSFAKAVIARLQTKR